MPYRTYPDYPRTYPVPSWYRRTGGSGGGGGGVSSLNYTPPIDGVAGIYSGYSTRKLRTSYSGYALQVRRASDNATQDIGFTSSGYIDTSAITSFVGANNGFVSIFYDQSSTGGRDLVQTTAANQPRIVLSGTLETQNGFVAPKFIFDNANWMSITSYSTAVTLSFGIVAHMDNRSVGYAHTLIGGVRDGFQFRAITAAGSINYLQVLREFSAAYITGASSVPPNLNQLWVRAGNTTSSIQVGWNGNYSTSSWAVNFATGARYVGFNQEGNSEFQDGMIYEIIQFDSLVSDSVRDTLVTNQMSYWTTATAPGSLMLDLVPGATGAYSMNRRLTSAWSGYLFRIRRSDNGSLYDIPFNSATGLLDRSALVLAGSGTTAAVAIWYDQSSNGNNMFTNNTNEMPPCFDSTNSIYGLSNDRASYVAMSFFGGSKKLYQATVASMAATVFGIVCVNATGPRTIVAGASAGDILLGVNSLNTLRVTRQNQLELGTMTFSSGVARAVGVAVQSTGVATNLFMACNSVVSVFSYTSTLGKISYIGEKGDTSSDQWDGQMSEIVVYPTMISSTNFRTAHTNQLSYYNLPQ